jgi:hypothetical protein
LIALARGGAVAVPPPAVDTCAPSGASLTAAA